MNMLKNLWRVYVPLLVMACILLVLAGCEGSSSKATDSVAAKNPNDPQLFTIPQEQMSHVQVLTVQPVTLTRTLRLTGAVAYNEDALPEEYRVACSLYFIQDFSYEEIARTLDVPLGTVRSRIHRGRKLLQQRLWGLAEEQGIVKRLTAPA